MRGVPTPLEVFDTVSVSSVLCTCQQFDFTLTEHKAAKTRKQYRGIIEHVSSERGCWASSMCYACSNKFLKKAHKMVNITEAKALRRPNILIKHSENALQGLLLQHSLVNYSKQGFNHSQTSVCLPGA